MRWVIEIVFCAALFAVPAAQAATISSPNTPIPISDNTPLGGPITINDTLTFPTLPLQDVNSGVEITVNIINSDITGLELRLTDPNSVTYTLFDGGQAGTMLIDTYLASSILPAGDLSTWIGQNPSGLWRLEVADTLFLNNHFDGALNSWSVTASPAVVPLPAALPLFLTGLAWIGVLGWRRRKSAVAA